jgi:hypothetical protein
METARRRPGKPQFTYQKHFAVYLAATAATVFASIAIALTLLSAQLRRCIMPCLCAASQSLRYRSTVPSPRQAEPHYSRFISNAKGVGTSSHKLRTCTSRDVVVTLVLI